MEITIISLYRTLVLLLLHLTLSISQFTTKETTFLSCLHRQSVPDTIISSTSTNATAYSVLLNSTAQNPRTIAAKTLKPLLIVSPTGETHVQHVVTCARSLGIRIRVRSGGHDYEGLSYVSYSDPFVLLDLANLRSISVNTTGGTAWVQSGATVGELYYTIAEKAGPNFGFPAGTCPTIGIGGHLGGGGIGVMMRAYGLAADNIVDARLVNVDGEIKDRESMGEDVFWAIRGGGAGSFGVVLSFRIKLVPVPTTVTVFNVNKTLAEGATKLATRWQHVAYRLDDRLIIRMIIYANANKTVTVMFNSLFLGGKKDLLTLMAASFPELGLREEYCIEMSWIDSTVDDGRNLSALLQRGHDPHFSSFKSKSDFVTNPMSEETWDEIFSRWFVGKRISPTLVVEPLGGWLDAIPETSIPFPHRKGKLYIIQYLWKWSVDDAGGRVAKENVDMSRRMYEYMRPYVSKNPRSAYVNYRDLDLGRNRDGENGSSSYSKASVWGERYFGNNFRRLAHVKAKIDPDNFFRNEQSVPPLL